MGRTGGLVVVQLGLQTMNTWAEEVPYGWLVFSKTLSPKCHSWDKRLPSLGGSAAQPQASLRP